MTEMMTVRRVSRQAKQQRVSTTFAASATRPTAAYGSSPAQSWVALALKAPRSKRPCDDRTRQRDEHAHRRNRDEVDHPQPHHDALPDARFILARELRREQREDHRGDGGREDLLREADELGRVVHARHVARAERRGEVAVEEQCRLPGSRADHDRAEHQPDPLQPRMLEVDDRPVDAQRDDGRQLHEQLRAEPQRGAEDEREDPELAEQEEHGDHRRQIDRHAAERGRVEAVASVQHRRPRRPRGWWRRCSASANASCGSRCPFARQGSRARPAARRTARGTSPRRPARSARSAAGWRSCSRAATPLLRRPSLSTRRRWARAR